VKQQERREISGPGKNFQKTRKKKKVLETEEQKGDRSRGQKNFLI